MSISIGVILDRKGTDVYMIQPADRVSDAVRSLREHDVGALIVSSTGRDVAGIVSERDIVRHLATTGAATLDQPVAEIMTPQVRTCERSQTTSEIMHMMTTHRVRHLPVVEDGRMVGVISIRDVVESYVGELEVTTEALSEYVTGSAY